MASTLVQKATGADESEAQKEMKRLYKKLTENLNNLSSLQFTPLVSEKAMELDVSKKNVRAVTVEEVIPDGTSDEDVIKAKEVLNAEKKESKGEV